MAGSLPKGKNSFPNFLPDFIALYSDDGFHNDVLLQYTLTLDDEL